MSKWDGLRSKILAEENRRIARSVGLICFCSVLLVVLSSTGAYAESEVDIRAGGVITAEQDSIAYILSVADCTELISAAVTAGETDAVLALSEARRTAGSAGGCEFDFTAAGEGRFSPQATLKFQDGTTQTHSESFQVERTPPELVFEGVTLSDFNSRQHLVVSVRASDDVDLRYVGFDVTGLRASDLRAAGGVVARARERAFAATGGFQRVYPGSDDQALFALPVAVAGELSAEAIAHDGVVLVDIVAVDASGNQSSLSKISFTGDDVVEAASDLAVQPAGIIFTNLLETAVLTPSVNFQFRGRTPLPGRGSGVAYASSHPDLIAVTTGGIVYPLAETGAETVTITVSYPDLDPVEIPVQVDLTKYLTSLEVADVNAEGQWILDRLNTHFALPNVVGVFNDNSRSEISSQFALEYILDDSTAGILELDEKAGLLARAIVPAASPALLTVRLKHQPDILATIGVAALDAIPTVALKVPSQVKAGASLTLAAEADDDVGVAEVRFLMDGTEVGVRRQPPYELTLEIPATLVNETLKFRAVAADTAGQENQSADRPVKVAADLQVQVPPVALELPGAMQRFVEASPIRCQAATEVADAYTGSGISYVEFFLDGKLIGESHFPLYEERATGWGQERTFEIWRFDGIVDAVSTTETTRALHAVVHTASGGQSTTEARLIRVIENR
ncbi:MAG: Ig-like domain-containing protein, partial [Desulfobacterales bacterium]